jgi:outer membrane biosynthesis protein TonB
MDNNNENLINYEDKNLLNKGLQESYKKKEEKEEKKDEKKEEKKEEEKKEVKNEKKRNREVSIEDEGPSSFKKKSKKNKKIKKEPTSFITIEKSTKRFDQIGGIVEVLKDIQNLIFKPFKYPGITLYIIITNRNILRVGG